MTLKPMFSSLVPISYDVLYADFMYDAALVKEPPLATFRFSSEDLAPLGSDAVPL